MSKTQGLLGWLITLAIAWAGIGAASANAIEVHNFIEPPFGSLGEIGDIAVDQSNGNVYAVDREKHEVRVFDREGGAPAEGLPASFNGTGSFVKAFEILGGVAVGPSRHEVFVVDDRAEILDKYVLNGADEYEYACEFKYYGLGDRCLADGGEATESTEPEGTQFVVFEDEGVAVDTAGDVYVAGNIPGNSEYGPEGAIFEFDPAGHALHAFAVPLAAGEGEANLKELAVAPDGTMYALVDFGPPYFREVLELKRSTPTGAVEGGPTVVAHTEGAFLGPESAKGIAFDGATGQLFVDLGSVVEALDGTHEIVSRFGAGVIGKGGALAVDEATGEVLVADENKHDVERFGPGLVGSLPTVDAPPPALAGVTRTSALLSGTVNPGNATTSWNLEYVAAGEYAPQAANPYAAGGSTPPAKLAPSATGTAVGPAPLTGLLAGTTYHYRLVASNELGTTYGPDHTFATAAATPPVVATGAASEVTQTAATLSGTVGTQELSTSYEFEVGTDTGYGGAKLFGNAGSVGSEPVSIGLQFLIPNTTYHYRLVASNADGTTYGQDMTFTTPAVPASIAQPTAEVLLSAPAGAFPSVAGAITKAHGTGKGHRRKRSKTAKQRHRKRSSGGGKRGKGGRK